MTDFLNDFLPAEESPEPADVIPDWAQSHDTALGAYRCIKELKDNKLTFIKTRGATSQDFKKKSNWQISKAEVAKIVGKDGPSLFHKATFSPPLSDLLDDANDQLKQLVEKKLNAAKRGLQAQPKVSLIKEVQTLRKEQEEAKKTELADVYELALSQLSLDVRRKLSL